ncbi:hypothetical protein HYQ44_004421 [Verticillium longisporum]|nr:hypothetical protein HYQ44_004421 [Verticillium longisporum]
MLARLPALFLRATKSNVSTPAKEKATDHATFDASQVGTSGNPITSPRHIRPTDEREHKNGGDPRTLAESVWSVCQTPWGEELAKHRTALQRVPNRDPERPSLLFPRAASHSKYTNKDCDSIRA